MGRVFWDEGLGKIFKILAEKIFNKIFKIRKNYYSNKILSFENIFRPKLYISLSQKTRLLTRLVTNTIINL